MSDIWKFIIRRRWVAMIPSRETLWMLLSGALVVYVILMDARPYVSRLLERRRDVCTIGLLSLWFESGEVKTNFGVGHGIRLAERQGNGLMVEFEKAIRPETLVVRAAGTKIKIPLIERVGRRAVIDCSALAAASLRPTRGLST
jgi:hypothetical protein